MKIRFAVILLLLFCFVVAEAARDKWVLLGQRRVALVTDRDEILVTGWRGEFKRIQIHVLEKGVHFEDITVVFANGRKFDFNIRSFIPAGGHSRVIDLPGKARVIHKIVLVFRTRAGASDKATVQVWGLRN